MKFKALLDTAVRRINTCESNKSKAYSVLWDCCSKSMKSQIQLREDFQEKIYNNSIKLSKAIK